MPDDIDKSSKEQPANLVFVESEQEGPLTDHNLQNAQNFEQPQLSKVNATLEELKVTPNGDEFPSIAESRDDAEVEGNILA